MTNPEIIVHADAGSLVEAVVGQLVAEIIRAQQSAGDANIVLTGGRTGIAVCEALAGSAAAFAQERLGLWWGDERYLPTGNPDRNDEQARHLLDSVPNARLESILGPDASMDAATSARDYAESYAAITPDVLLLSLGPDGHIASLFPEHAALHTADTLAVAVHGAPKQPPTRVSLSLPGICRAREVWILASGEEKAEAVRLSLDEHAGVLQAPSVGTRGTRRTLLLLDQAAASQLPVGLARPVS